MKTLFLIRHAIPAFPDGREICMGSRYDYPLSEEGLLQAKELAIAFSSVPLDAIYTSPLKRCMETAAPLADHFGLRPVVIEDLRELDGGPWEGLTREERRKRFPDCFGEERKLPPGAESDDAGIVRARSALRTALDGTKGYCACVTHAGLARLLLADLSGLKPGQISMGYAQVKVLTEEQGHLRLQGDLRFGG